mgnify:CR=1 FL=1
MRSHLTPEGALQEEARVSRIAAEARVAFAALAGVQKAVCIFGSAQSAPVSRWGDLTERTSAALARAGFGVVTGGGPGLMAAANRAARAAGGTSVGLTIHLPEDEPANPFLDLRVPFHYFFLVSWAS